jgi:hypothetical protein
VTLEDPLPSVQALRELSRSVAARLSIQQFSADGKKR